jgi:hypothetical protein
VNLSHRRGSSYRDDSCRWRRARELCKLRATLAEAVRAEQQAVATAKPDVGAFVGR